MVRGGLSSFVVVLCALSSGCTPFGGDDPVVAPEGGIVDGAMTDGGGADAGTSCAGHDFCADFESSAKGEWDDAVEDNSGAVGVAPSTDGSQALRTYIGALTDGAATAFVTKSFFRAMGLHVELDVNVAVADVKAPANFAILEIAAGEPRVVVYVIANSPNVALYMQHTADTGAATTENTPLSIKEGSWFHLTVDVVFGARGTLHVDIDQKVAWDSAFVTLPSAAPIALNVGLQRYHDTTPPLSSLYDSVRVDLKKP